MADAEIRVPVVKLDRPRQLVFGWANVFLRKDGEPEDDTQGDVIDTPEAIEAFEDAVYEYVLESRSGDEMHVKFGTARLVESMVFTPEKIAKLGLPEGALPVGAWMGFKVDDPETWDRVDRGELTMFSIVGAGDREDI